MIVGQIYDIGMGCIDGTYKKPPLEKRPTRVDDSIRERQDWIICSMAYQLIISLWRVMLPSQGLVQDSMLYRSLISVVTTLPSTDQSERYDQGMLDCLLSPSVMYFLLPKGNSAETMIVVGMVQHGNERLLKEGSTEMKL